MVDMSFDEVYGAFIQYFNDKGIPIETPDKFTGEIETKDIMITDMFIADFLKKDKSSPYYGMSLRKISESIGKNGVKLSYCDCGLAKYRVGMKTYVWQNLFYRYKVNIKEEKNNKTSFRVKALFWTEIFRIWDFWVTYEGTWDCASSGEYEKKVIEEIKTNYLKKH